MVFEDQNGNFHIADTVSEYSKFNITPGDTFHFYEWSAEVVKVDPDKIWMILNGVTTQRCFFNYSNDTVPYEKSSLARWLNFKRDEDISNTKNSNIMMAEPWYYSLYEHCPLAVINESSHLFFRPPMVEELWSRTIISLATDKTIMMSDERCWGNMMSPNKRSAANGYWLYNEVRDHDGMKLGNLYCNKNGKIFDIADHRIRIAVRPVFALRREI